MKTTIDKAPSCLNTNDKAMWVTGWNEAIDTLAREKAKRPIPEHVALLCEAYDFGQFSSTAQLNRLPATVLAALQKLLDDVQESYYCTDKEKDNVG